MKKLKSKVVITYGTFDMFHIGHLRLIQRIRDYGDKVIICVSTDDFNEIKGKKCIIPFEDRCEIVRNIKGVDMVLPENNWEQKVFDIKHYNVDVFVMGDDWKNKFDHLMNYCEVIYLPRTPMVSSTLIKKSILTPGALNKENIEQTSVMLKSIRDNFK